MNKEGQFYLVAAVIIVAILIGFATVGNIANIRGERENIKLYELSQDLALEGESVINHGIFNTKDLDVLLEDFSIQYGEYISDKENDIFFIYGDDKTITVLGYVNALQGSVGLNIGGSVSTIEITGKTIPKRSYSPRTLADNPNVLVDVGGTQYPFPIKRGENFFFIIRQPSGIGGASNV